MPEGSCGKKKERPDTQGEISFLGVKPGMSHETFRNWLIRTGRSDVQVWRFFSGRKQNLRGKGADTGHTESRRPGCSGGVQAFTAESRPVRWPVSPGVGPWPWRVPALRSREGHCLLPAPRGDPRTRPAAVDPNTDSSAHRQPTGTGPTCRKFPG